MPPSAGPAEYARRPARRSPARDTACPPPAVPAGAHGAAARGPRQRAAGPGGTLALADQPRARRPAAGDPGALSARWPGPGCRGRLGLVLVLTAVLKSTGPAADRRPVMPQAAWRWH